jgi:mannopine transport system substrate-binding protein
MTMRRAIGPMFHLTRRHLLATAALVAAAGAWAPAARAFEASAAAKAEGEVVIATAGGMLQDALGQHLYEPFTAATGIKVTPVTINPQEQWAKVKADTESGGVQWDLVNVGPDSLVLQQQFLADLGPDCAAIPNLARNGAPGVCQGRGFLYILGGYILGVKTEAFPDGTPQNAADFFDTAKFPGPRALSSNEPVYNMMLALAADGVTQDKLWPLDIPRALSKLDTLKPSIASWWESSDQAMQAWRGGEVVMSTFWAGRIIQLQEEGQAVVPVWSGFPRDISGFALLKDAPHPEAAKAFIDFFFSDEAAPAVLALSEQINYDPPNRKALELPSKIDPTKRATYPDNWNAMLAIDVDVLKGQQKDIEMAWQEWIAK